MICIFLEEIRPFHNGEKYEAKVFSVYADVNGEWSKLPLPKGLIYWALCRRKVPVTPLWPQKRPEGLSGGRQSSLMLKTTEQIPHSDVLSHSAWVSVNSMLSGAFFTS